MVRITEGLLRKRAEHNNCEILTLEEISLHQQDIEKIELLDKLCRDLKIVYLQSNLIPTIENVGRLKKLEYLNLALNNITKIEHLEGCESLKKLDLTVNFVGELTSINSLKGNYHLRELFLTGNPCTDYEGYRQYVIATLVQLKWLDGQEVEKSERILAIQDYETIKVQIEQQQTRYELKREKEREDAANKRRMEEDDKRADEELKENRTKNWYTDIGSSKINDKTPEEEDEEERRFWQQKVEYTPESRLELHKHIEEKRKQKANKDEAMLGGVDRARVTRFFADDGRVLNLNQGKWDFHLTDDEENNTFILDLSCYRHVDTSLMDVDVQPTYVRVIIKGKSFQLALSEEVNPDSSSAKRSQTTGHLLVSMPKMEQIVKPLKKVVPHTTKQPPAVEKKEDGQRTNSNDKRTLHERLDVDTKPNKEMDFSNIVGSCSKTKKPSMTEVKRNHNTEPEDKDFVDDPDVPPLI